MEAQAADCKPCSLKTRCLAGVCFSRKSELFFLFFTPTIFRLTNGASVKLVGQLVSSRGPGQEKEFLVDRAEITGECDPQVNFLKCFKCCLIHDLLQGISYSEASAVK